MHRLVKMRRLVIRLSLCVALLGALACVALWHVFKPMQALSAPSLHNSGFHVDQLQVQYERFLEALWTFSAGRVDANALSLRLDIVASRLAPARELTDIASLPGPNGVLLALEKKIDIWTPVVGQLRDGDEASRARALLLIDEVRDFRSRVQDMVVETNRKFGEQRDHERLLFFERFRWLVMTIGALAFGMVLLVVVLWRQLSSSSQMADSLADLNHTLEDRVASRTLQLEERERQLHTILDASPIAVALLRLEDHRLLFANQRFRRQFEPAEQAASSQAGDLAKQCFESIFASETAAQDFWRVFHISQSLEDYEVQLRGGSDAEGQPGWALVSARELVMDGVAVLLFWAYDITTRKELEAELWLLAHTDPLTGVLNRRAFAERGAETIAAARRHQRPLSVLMLDIDHFKTVNDSYGHAAGDEAILQVVALSSRNLRAHDLLGRLGGEEFGILLPETDTAEALITAERLRAAIAAQKVAVGGVRITLTVSIGLATLVPHEDAAALYRRADTALYKAKRGGRNCVFTAAETLSDSKR